MSIPYRALLPRLAAVIIALIGVSIVIFGIARIMPGDPARIALGPNASEQQVAELRHERHLDQPLPVQYWEYVKALSHGDLGQSLYTNRPVAKDIAQYLPATLELIIMSGIIILILGLPIGIISAHFRGRAPDHIARLVALLGVCTPAFVWGVILQLVFGYFYPIFPIEGRLTSGLTPPVSHTGFYLIDSLISGNFTVFADSLHHILLPAVALAMSGMGQVARMTRSNMIETYEKPYTEMARSFGFSPWRIATRFAFRPAMIPTLTILGLEFASLLGNAFLVEKVFGWPGISRYGADVIIQKDLDAIVGTVLIIAFAFLFMNIVVDVLVTLVNPRIRLSSRRS